MPDETRPMRRLLGFAVYPLIAVRSWAEPSDTEFHEFRLAFRDWLKAPKGPARDSAREVYCRLRDRQQLGN